MATNSSIAVLTDILKNLDELNSEVESYLFGKIKKTEYLVFINSNPEFGARLNILLDDEVELRAKIHMMKKLLELEDEMQQFGISEVQAVLQEGEERQNTLKSIMKHASEQ